MLDRRTFLGACAAWGSTALSGCVRSVPWERQAYRKRERSHVAVVAARTYEVSLPDIIRQALKLFPLALSGKTVVLKPNLVEFDPQGFINTHPSVVSATVDAFRRLGAKSVIVAEGPGHRRDNEYLLTASGLHAALEELKAPYVDLNTDAVRSLKLRSRFTDLGHLYFPETVLSADLVVSMPKLKTHHWAGVTLSLKNFFGIVPGSVYGWPKNVLHWAGIHESILDINSTLPIPQFAIVDGIVGMEGNGPIQGAPKAAGILILGDDLVAVDATAARLMNVDPGRITYIEQAGRFLGNVRREQIVQIGERPESFQQDFRVIEGFQYLKTATG